MTDLAEVFRDQARSCKQLGSPFMDQLLRLTAENLSPGGAVMDRMLAWKGDTSSKGASIPLRFAGGLHALFLTGKAPELGAVYPPNTANDVQLWSAISDALVVHNAFLMDWMDRPPQTNEVRRAVALIPAAAMITARFRLPLQLSELGASAGLNLNFDQFALELEDQTIGSATPALTLTPDWTGPVPEANAIRVVERRGCDLSPLQGPDAALRLRAYLWPDQPERVALLKAALTCPAAPVDAADVSSWLPNRLASQEPGACHMIYHTVAWQYFPKDVQENCTRVIEAAGAKATAEAPLALFGMEADGTEDGAALRLRLWPGDLIFTLGRADFHGRWVRWDPQEI